MNKYSINSVSDLQSFSDPNDKRINPQLYKSGYSKTTVQFPPRALSGSSNMSPESIVALMSWDGGVFFDFGGTFVTGFTVLGEKMSSLKEKRSDKILIKKCN